MGGRQLLKADGEPLGFTLYDLHVLNRCAAFVNLFVTKGPAALPPTHPIHADIATTRDVVRPLLDGQPTPISAEVLFAMSNLTRITGKGLATKGKGMKKMRKLVAKEMGLTEEIALCLSEKLVKMLQAIADVEDGVGSKAVQA